MAAYVKGQTGNPRGRPPMGQTTRDKFIKLLGQENIDNMLMEDFKKGNGNVRQFVYDHLFGKPVIKTDNDTKITLPEAIVVEIVKPSGK